MTTAALTMSGDERTRLGVIVSFASPAGRRLTLHRVGPVRQAVLEACEDALAIDPMFKAVAFSTPSTIYADVNGRVPETTHNQVATYRYPETRFLPEHVVHPRYLGASATAQSQPHAGRKPRRARP